MWVLNVGQPPISRPPPPTSASPQVLPDELAAVAADQDEKEALAGATLASDTTAAAAAAGDAAAEAAAGRRTKHKKHKKPCEEGAWGVSGSLGKGSCAHVRALLALGLCEQMSSPATQAGTKPPQRQHTLSVRTPPFVAGLNRKIESMLKPYTSKYAGAFFGWCKVGCVFLCCCATAGGRGGRW